MDADSRSARHHHELAELRTALARARRALTGWAEPTTWATPHRETDRLGSTRLLRFDEIDHGGATPLIIVYAMVNRPYVLDLAEDRSFVRGLLDGRRPVYVMDWGDPEPEDHARPLADYVGRLASLVDRVRERHGVDAVDLLGVCQGGTLSLCHAGLSPASVRRLVTMVTPVDFGTTDNLLGALVRSIDVDGLVAGLGAAPGALLNAGFLALRPLRLGGQKYLDALVDLQDAGRAGLVLRMERWIQDSPDQPLQAFREFVRLFFVENRLARGRLELDGREVSLTRLQAPVLNVYATRDHIVPPASARALGTRLREVRYQELPFDGGHIGIYVSRRAGATVPGAIARWLDA